MKYDLIFSIDEEQKYLYVYYNNLRYGEIRQNKTFVITNNYPPKGACLCSHHTSNKWGREIIMYFVLYMHPKFTGFVSLRYTDIKQLKKFIKKGLPHNVKYLE